MTTPSSNWLSNLILVIQECKAETDVEFHTFLETTFSGMPLNSLDYELVQRLKKEFDLDGRRRAGESDMWPELPFKATTIIDGKKTEVNVISISSS